LTENQPLEAQRGEAKCEIDGSRRFGDRSASKVIAS